MCNWCAKKQRTCSAVESSHLSICPAHLVTPGKALLNIVVGPQLTGGNAAGVWDCSAVSRWSHTVTTPDEDVAFTIFSPLSWNRGLIRQEIPSLMVPHISWGLLSAPLHMTSCWNPWQQITDAFSSPAASVSSVTSWMNRLSRSFILVWR